MDGHHMSETLESVIRKWVVNDYFTPNIKAEVILDLSLIHISEPTRPY